MTANTIPYAAVKADLLKDQDVRREYDALAPANQVARLRVLRGLTQEQLAALVGTQQPSIARLESGAQDPSLAFLRRVAAALGSHVEIHLVPDDPA
jgi:DNA-binding XRE family transcriptional regulator